MGAQHQHDQNLAERDENRGESQPPRTILIDLDRPQHRQCGVAGEKQIVAHAIGHEDRRKLGIALDVEAQEVIP